MAMIYCSECGKPFETEFAYYYHLQNVHSVVPARSTPSAAFPRRDLGEILGRTFSLYGKRFWRLMAIVLIYNLVTLALMIGIFAMLPPDIANSVDEFTEIDMSIPSLLGVVALVIVAVIFLAPFTEGPVIHAVVSHEVGGMVRILQAYKFTFSRLWRPMVAIVILFAGLILLMGAAALVGAVFPPLLLLGIPGLIYLVVRWSFFFQTALIEQCGVFECFSRSWDLVRDNWWRVFGINLLVFVVLIPLTLLLEFIFQSVPLVASMAGGILLTPIAMIIQTLLYLDLRAQNDWPREFNTGTLAKEIGEVIPPSVSLEISAG